MDGLVSCGGSDCTLCQILQTASNIYNFILGISFAAAVLVLVIAGLIMVASTGNTERIEQSKKFIRGGTISFVLILTGWLAIHTLFLATGYQGKDHWWQVQCDTQKNSQDSPQLTQKSGETKNLAPTPTKNLAQPSPYDGLKTFTSLEEFLKSGEQKGKILGPNSPEEFTGQAKGLPKGKALRILAPVRTRVNDSAQDTFMSFLTITDNTEAMQLVSTGDYWSVLQNALVESYDQLGPTTVNDMISNLSKVPAAENVSMVTSNGTTNITVSGGDNSDTRQLNPLFSSIAALIASSQNSSSLGINTNQSNDNLDQLVASSAGDLIQKEKNTILSHSLANIITDTIRTSYVLAVELNNNGDATNSSQKDTADQANTNSSSNNSATSASTKDSDQDGVPDTDDACPDTPFSESNSINKDKKGEGVYGCSCYDLDPIKWCPEDACDGQYWVTYAHDEQPCENGHPLPYTCSPLSADFDPACPEPDEKAIAVPNDFHDERNIPYGEGYDTLDTPASSDSVDSVKKALKYLHEVDPLRYEMVFRFTQRIVDIKNPMAQDLITGYNSECGSVYTVFSLPIDDLVRTIVHEATHSAHACIDPATYNDTTITERLANANEIGSLSRVSSLKDMSEFPGQDTKIYYQDKEVRGFLSRLEDKVTPQYGDLGSAAYYGTVRYVTDFDMNLVKGPYHYGDDAANLVIGLTQGEEGLMEKIVMGSGKCLSKPTDDLPPVPACSNADKTIKIGGSDWYEGNY